MYPSPVQNTIYFATYCDKRTGQQSHTGRNSGKTARSLSQFLVDCPHAPARRQIFHRKSWRWSLSMRPEHTSALLKWIF